MFEKLFTSEKLWNGLPVFWKQRKHQARIHLRLPLVNLTITLQEVDFVQTSDGPQVLNAPQALRDSGPTYAVMVEIFVMKYLICIQS